MIEAGGLFFFYLKRERERFLFKDKNRHRWYETCSVIGRSLTRTISMEASKSTFFSSSPPPLRSFYLGKWRRRRNASYLSRRFRPDCRSRVKLVSFGEADFSGCDLGEHVRKLNSRRRDVDVLVNSLCPFKHESKRKCVWKYENIQTHL